MDPITVEWLLERLEKENNLNSPSITRFLRASFVRMLSNKCISQQQSCHMLLNLPFATSNIKFISVCLSNKRNINKKTVYLTYIDFYCTRSYYINKYPNILAYNLFKFVMEFEIKKINKNQSTNDICFYKNDSKKNII